MTQTQPEPALEPLDEAVWDNTRLSRLNPDITPEVYAASATARALSNLMDALLLAGAEPQVRAPTVSDWPSLHIPSRDTEIYVFGSIGGKVKTDSPTNDVNPAIFFANIDGDLLREDPTMFRAFADAKTAKKEA